MQPRKEPLPRRKMFLLTNFNTRIPFIIYFDPRFSRISSRQPASDTFYPALYFPVTVRSRWTMERGNGRTGRAEKKERSNQQGRAKGQRRKYGNDESTTSRKRIFMEAFSLARNESGEEAVAEAEEAWACLHSITRSIDVDYRQNTSLRQPL